MPMQMGKGRLVAPPTEQYLLMPDKALDLFVDIRDWHGRVAQRSHTRASGLGRTSRGSSEYFVDRHLRIQFQQLWGL